MESVKYNAIYRHPKGKIYRWPNRCRNNSYKAIKLFCDMNDVVLGWKKISKGLPKPRSASNDRTPNNEEIRKLIEYPDRRIKPIIFTIASSGIRLGAWDYLHWKHIVP